MTKRNPYVGDPRTKLAKAQGYPARSVFKLEEIDRRLGLFRGVRRVLDLGAAPGSWSLYASRHVPPDGKILAIDLKPIEQDFPAVVDVVQGDALSIQNELLARYAPYDLVLSDMAPNTSGAKIEDQLRSHELFMRAVEVGVALGRSGASFVGKLFMSGEFEKARAELRKHFNKVQAIRPEGTRHASSELFLVGLGLKRSGFAPGGNSGFGEARERCP
jgi:23S rRNA (uridine2552-2'-O)-methyltransferase